MYRNSNENHGMRKKKNEKTKKVKKWKKQDKKERKKEWRKSKFYYQKEGLKHRIFFLHQLTPIISFLFERLRPSSWTDGRLKNCATNGFAITEEECLEPCIAKIKFHYPKNYTHKRVPGFTFNCSSKHSTRIFFSNCEKGGMNLLLSLSSIYVLIAWFLTLNHLYIPGLYINK